VNYYPYFRGKQYELICLREQAGLIAAREFTPIIEPVKEGLGGLLRALGALSNAGAEYHVVANPSVGHHAGVLAKGVRQEIIAEVEEHPGFSWLFQIAEPNDVYALNDWLKKHPNTAILHHGGGAVASKDVLAVLSSHETEPNVNIFGPNSTTRYRSAFASSFRVLLNEGFKKQKNADYSEIEIFSELPATYQDLKMDGFGDYLIVGNEYSEGGGAAYAVAIHITFADPDEDGVIFVRHFVSTTNNTPLDPAGKFREALEKLVLHCNSSKSKLPKTKAIEEFRSLHASGHFPGLGYVKKLSMQHHLEMMGG